MDYTKEEYCDMLLIYGASNQNAHEAARRYVERYPNRRSPNPNVFLRLINRVRTSGSVVPIRKDIVGRNFYVRDEENEAEVLHAIEEDPTTSIREISRTTEMSRTTVQRILKENRLRAYHYTKVQHLMPQDYAQRINFCRWILQQEERQPGILQTIMFTDECLFTREGLFNNHNYHVWSQNNPHEYMVNNFQHRFKINLWAGIFDGTIVRYFAISVNTMCYVFVKLIIYNSKTFKILCNNN